jgi:MFS family permease
MRESLGVLRYEKSYRKLVTANFISGIGDWFSSVAILSLLLQITGSGLAVGLTLAARTIPFMLMGPIGGMLADKVNKKILLIVSDFARIFLAFSLLFVTSEDTLWIAYVVTVSLVVFSAISGPARQSLIPQIVQEKNLPAANAVDQSLNGINMTLGAVLGGFISATLGTDLAFIVNGLTFLISGLIICSMPYSSKKLLTTNSQKENEENLKSSFWMEFRKSLLMKVIIIQAFLWPLGGGAINVLISVYGYQVFNSGDRGVGILYGALGIGFLISGLIAPYFKKWMINVIIFSTMLEGIAHMLVSQSPNVWIGAIFIVIATIAAGIGNASFTTLIMTTIPPSLHGRTFALSDTTSNVMMALSMVATGILINYIPAQTVGLIAGFVVACSSLTAIPLLKLNQYSNQIDSNS